MDQVLALSNITFVCALTEWQLRFMGLPEALSVRQIWADLGLAKNVSQSIHLLLEIAMIVERPTSKMVSE